MTLNPKAQAALTSYARALIAAALPVWVATHDWKSALHALWAAAIPPIMRWANPSDPSIGRSKEETQ